jgi:hypothetical protein
VNLKELAKPLTTRQIDFRVQSINRGGYATILAYKDARVDMQRLDDVVGPLNWKREHTRDNHNCIVSIWDGSKWVSKEDTGTESYTEAAKGLASDSFKRACFNWGIGRELYDYPLVSVRLRDDEWNQDKDKPKGTYKLRPASWTWISEFREGRIIYLCAKQGDGVREEYCDDLADTITVIKDGIAENNLYAAAEAWFELSDQEKQGIFVAPSKGGPFTSAERDMMKSNAFRMAYYGEGE